jgi:hypothetical protein
MRDLVTVVLAVSVTVAAAGADEPADARAVIDRAVEAAGGSAKLAGLKAYTQKAKGTFHGPGGPVAFTGTWTVNWPDQVRAELDSESGGMKFHVVQVIAGDKGWLRVNDTLIELDRDAAVAEREQVYAAWVATLLPLKDKDFVLVPLEESKVGERPAAGVKVTHKDQRDVSLFFDKEKGWLLRAEFRVKSHQGDFGQEVLYDDYRDTDGLKRPWKTTVRRDGKVFVETEVMEFKPLDKADPKLFEKPRPPDGDADCEC